MWCFFIWWCFSASITYTIQSSSSLSISSNALEMPTHLKSFTMMFGLLAIYFAIFAINLASSSHKTGRERLIGWSSWFVYSSWWIKLFQYLIRMPFLKLLFPKIFSWLVYSKVHWLQLICCVWWNITNYNISLSSNTRITMLCCTFVNNLNWKKITSEWSHKTL